MQLWPGTAYPLGATWDGSGTNFALFSEAGERVELCLFGEASHALRILHVSVVACVQALQAPVISLVT